MVRSMKRAKAMRTIVVPLPPPHPAANSCRPHGLRRSDHRLPFRRAAAGVGRGLGLGGTPGGGGGPGAGVAKVGGSERTPPPPVPSAHRRRRRGEAPTRSAGARRVLWVSINIRTEGEGGEGRRYIDGVAQNRPPIPPSALVYEKHAHTPDRGATAGRPGGPPSRRPTVRGRDPRRLNSKRGGDDGGRKGKGKRRKKGGQGGEDRGRAHRLGAGGGLSGCGDGCVGRGRALRGGGQPRKGSRAKLNCGESSFFSKGFAECWPFLATSRPLGPCAAVGERRRSCLVCRLFWHFLLFIGIPPPPRPRLRLAAAHEVHSIVSSWSH